MFVCTTSLFISVFLFLAEGQPNTSAITERLKCLNRKAECDIDFGCKMRLRTIAIRCNVEIFYEDTVFQKPITQCTEECREEIRKLVKYRAGLELVSMGINKNDDPNGCFALSSRAQSCLKQIRETGRMYFHGSTASSCTTVFTFCKHNKRCSKILFPSYNICDRFLNLNQTTSLCHSPCAMMIKDIDIENRKATYWAQILLKCRCRQSDVNCQNFPETFKNIKSQCPPKNIISDPGEVTRVLPTSLKLPKTIPSTNAGNVHRMFCYIVIMVMYLF